MAAIITDQLRILNAKNFVAGVQTSSNSYYAFIGLPNPEDYQSDWDTSPPAPKDSLDQANDYWDTMLAMKKINSSDVSQVVRKTQWASGITMICGEMISLVITHHNHRVHLISIPQTTML